MLRGPVISAQSSKRGFFACYLDIEAGRSIENMRLINENNIATLRV